MGLKTIPEDSTSLSDIAPDSFQKKPLYVWLRSFAGRELDEDDSFANFVSSNALAYALEYIGIASENEQSSLHLSAIFDEESHHQSRSNKYPSHFESETKSRIQQLNRVFVELISYYDYHHGQIVAIKPPNTVHISSSCHLCGVREFEKFLFLIMGAAIQGTQKQETIKKIKRFPQEIQESLINCIKLIAAESPELINIKSWQEFHSQEEDEQKKTYENLLAVIRRLLIERNESIQNQLLSDYYAGFMNCSQRRIYESKGYGSYSDTEKYSDDTRMSAAVRQLREELQVKSELLQECREELEITKYQVRELETELTETQIKLRAYKKARDELDVLREGQVKNTRLESELHRLKNKLEEAEHVYERVEVLEVENRKLQLQHDVLVDQISFLSLDRPSFDCSQNSSGIIGIVPNLSSNDLDHTLTKDEDKFFESDEDEEEPSVKEKIVKEGPVEPVQTIHDELQAADNKTNEKQQNPENERSPSPLVSADESNVHDQKKTEEDVVESIVNEKQDNAIECNNEFENICDFNSQLLNANNGDGLEAGPLTSTPVPASKQPIEQKSQEVQTPPFQLSSSSKRKKRSAVVNLKRSKKPIYIPVLPGQKLFPVVPEGVIAENVQGLDKEGSSSPAIKVFKIYNVHRPGKRRSTGKPKKFKTPNGRPLNDKPAEPNVDVGHEADEELSISPNGPRNESDLDSNIDATGHTEKRATDNEEIYFSPDPAVTHPDGSLPVSTTPSVSTSASHTVQLQPDLPESPSHYGTTTAFPVTNSARHTHIVHHVTFSPNNDLPADENEDEHHSNHLTIFNHQNNNNNNNNIIKDIPEEVQLPLLRITNGINVSLHHSDTDEEDDEVRKRLRSAYSIQLQHQLQQQQQQQAQAQDDIPHCESSSNSLPTPTNGQINNNNNDNEFSFSDCNIQVSLRNSSIKPAIINKISTLTSSNNFGGNGSAVGGGILRGSHQPPSGNPNQPQYYHAYYQPSQEESSSEDDASVWYEYGCV